MSINTKSKKYWEKRQHNREARAFSDIKKVEKEFKYNLAAANDNIKKEIESLTVRYMKDTNLSYPEAVKMLKGNEYRIWRKEVGGYVEELKKLKDSNPIEFQKMTLELETLAYRSRISRLDALKTEIDMELIKSSVKNKKLLDNSFSEVYGSTYNEIMKDLGVKAAIDIERLKGVISYPWSGMNYSSRIWSNTDALSKVLKEDIVQSMQQGINYKEMSKRIQNRFETSYSNAERLIRTELNYVQNQSTLAGYDDAGIEKYQYLAELDHRTTVICASLNSEIFELKDAAVGINYPPMHVRCRSTTIPIIDFDSI